MTDKPPLGVRPKRIWLEQRVAELLDAIYRQAAHRNPNWALVVLWSQEVTEHSMQLANPLQEVGF